MGTTRHWWAVALLGGAAGCVPEIRVVGSDAAADQAEVIRAVDAAVGVDATPVADAPAQPDETGVDAATDRGGEGVDLPDATLPDLRDTAGSDLPDAAMPDLRDATTPDLPDAATPDLADVTQAELPDAAIDVPGARDAATCPMGQVECTSRCTDTRSDARHCGACGTACGGANGTPTCAAGVCEIACAAGFGDCDGDVANGCEVVTSTSFAHCGACGVTCSIGRRCAAGRCEPAIACPSGMRLVRAGEFDMGAADISDASPLHRVRVSTFCMDETEVTAAAYAQCPVAMGCSTPGTMEPCNWAGTGPIAGREGHPINCVDWRGAAAYCTFRGGALPTEAQWEYAARGSDGRIYPWGSTPVPSAQLCWRGSANLMSTCATREFPSGNSPFGLFDMAGNVFEWTADWYGSYSAGSGAPTLDPTGPSEGVFRVYRGSSWREIFVSGVRTMVRNRAAPEFQAAGVGFRCARRTL